MGETSTREIQRVIAEAFDPCSRLMGDPVYVKKVLNYFDFDKADKHLAPLTIAEIEAVYQSRILSEKRALAARRCQGKLEGR